MAFTPQQLSDLEEIKQVKSRYCRGTDTCNEKVIREVFTDDVAVHYRGGAYTAKLDGIEAMLDFLFNSHHSTFITMHHAHLPDIQFTGPDSAEGTWYCEDFHINFDHKVITKGCLIYKDRYVRKDGVWKMSSTEYDRVWEANEPLNENIEITAHALAKTGLKPEQRKDISHLLKWKNREHA